MNIQAGDTYWIDGEKVTVTSVSTNFVQIRYEDGWGTTMTIEEFLYSIR